MPAAAYNFFSFIDVLLKEEGADAVNSARANAQSPAWSRTRGGSFRVQTGKGVENGKSMENMSLRFRSGMTAAALAARHAQIWLPSNAHSACGTGCRIQSDGSTPHRRPHLAKVSPAPYLSCTVTVPTGGFTAQPPYQERQRLVPCYARRAAARKVEIAPAKKGFLPPATRGLGCTSPAGGSGKCRRSVPLMSVMDTRAAISKKCHPSGLRSQKAPDRSCLLAACRRIE
jgi:hypothetical protein